MGGVGESQDFPCEVFCLTVENISVEGNSLVYLSFRVWKKF